MPDENAPARLAVVILGTDAVIAAAPVTPVQIAHACLAAGFAAVVPASWGDELIATECLRRAAARGREPAVCAVCPRVTERLIASGAELAPFTISLVPPPVATARYLRAMWGDDRLRITYVGACPGAVDESLDERMLPVEFFSMLGEQGISMSEQPEVFDSIIPPDRRRYQSLPGGVPTAEALWSAGGRALIEIDDDDYVSDLAQRLVSREHALLDVAPKLGCACSGAIAGVQPRSARVAATAYEPPRSALPVIDASIPVDLVRPLPAARRGEHAVPVPPPVALPGRPVPAWPASDLRRAEQAPAASAPAPAEPSAQVAAAEPVAPRRRPAGGTTVRALGAGLPTVNSGEGRALPRAYVARRRTGRTPPDNAAIRPVPASAPPREREMPIEAAIETSLPRLAPSGRVPLRGLQRDEWTARAQGAQAAVVAAARRPLYLALVVGGLVLASAVLGVAAGRRLAGDPARATAEARSEVDSASGMDSQGLISEPAATRTIERGGSVGPELRAPAQPGRPSADDGQSRTPRTTSRTGASQPARARQAPRGGAAAVATTPPAREPVATVSPRFVDTTRAAAEPVPTASAPPVDTARGAAAAITALPAAARQDSIDRELEAIARELRVRRARLDSLARRDSLRNRPPR